MKAFVVNFNLEEKFMMLCVVLSMKAGHDDKVSEHKIGVRQVVQNGHGLYFKRCEP